jgi:hypothetical protein
MRGRPDVDIKMPAMAHPGDDIDVKLVVTSRSDTPIDFIDLLFHGEEVASPPGQAGMRSARTLVDKAVRLRAEGKLAEGRHDYSARFRIPRDAPGSYVGVQATIAYEVRLHVSIPWWPDLREAYELIVEPHGSARPEPAPATRTGERTSGPFVELSLVDTTFAAGDEISGAFAIGNVPRGGGREVEISLVGLERARILEHERISVLARHIAPGVHTGRKDGGEVAFRFRVPAGVVPSFQSRLCELAWAVDAQLRMADGSGPTCRVPVQIGRHAAARTGSRARPRVGADRWRRMWSEAGEARGLALHDDRLALLGSRGEVQLEIERDESEDEAKLTATLRYPSLELGLRLTPHRIVVFPNELEGMFAGCEVKCREPRQARGFFTPALREALAAFGSARIEDTRAVVTAPGSGLDAASLSRFLDAADALAAALAGAIASIPPPASMRDALPAWRAFADATGARLSTGGMSLMAASVDGAVFDVATSLDGHGAPTGTRVSLEIDPPLEIEVDLEDPATFAAAPPGSRDLAIALRAMVRSLAIAPHALTVEMDGAVADPADLRPRMAEMLVLARRLRGDRAPGPYR